MLNYWILKGWRLVWFGLFPACVGAVVALQGWFWRQDSTAFLENLRDTEGRIVQFTPLSNSLQIEVEYMDESGVPFHKKFQVDQTQEAELRATGRISLSHDTRDPHRAEMGHVVSVRNEMYLETGVLAVGLLVVLAGAGYLARCARDVMKIGRLFRQGAIVETQVRDVNMAPGNQVGRFTYAFRGPNGRWFEGKSPELPAAKLTHWPVGQAVLAAYDQADPRRTEADVFGVMAGMRKDLPQTA